MSLWSTTNFTWDKPDAGSEKNYHSCSLAVSLSHVKFDLWPLLYEHVKTGITYSCNKNQIPIHHCNLRNEISSFPINFKKSYYYCEIVIIINLAVLFWLTDIWEVWKGCEVSRQHNYCVLLLRAQNNLLDGGRTRCLAKEIYARSCLVTDRSKYWEKI